jgi:hypothetical protein
MANPIHLDVADNVNAAEWDGAVKRLGGTVFHSSTWADYVHAQHPNARPRFARWMGNSEEPLGLALMFVEVSSRRALASLTGILRTEAAPLVANGHGDAAIPFATAITNYARRQNIATVSVGSFGGNAGRTAFEQLGFTQTRFWEFAIDLTASEDALLRNMDATRRQMIRKASRMGVVVRELLGRESARELRRLQAASSKRIVARGGPDIVRRGEHSEDRVDVLLRSGVGRVLAAEIDGQVISAGLFTCFNGVVYFTRAGHSDEALRAQAPTFLLWKAIERYKAEGARCFNFGGCSAAAVEAGHPEHGVYTYKRDFGGRQLECTEFSKVLFPIRHRTGVLIKRLLQRPSNRPKTHESQ